MSSLEQFDMKPIGQRSENAQISITPSPIDFSPDLPQSYSVISEKKALLIADFLGIGNLFISYLSIG